MIERADAALRWVKRLARPRPKKPDHVFERFFSQTNVASLFGGAGFTVGRHERICFYPGPEGGGVFGQLLAKVASRRLVRERFVEPLVRPAFHLIERLRIVNQKQLILGRKL